jgi:peptide/nickel transport system substrate-binding protein
MRTSRSLFGNRLLRLLACVFLLALVASACGADDEPAAPDTSAADAAALEAAQAEAEAAAADAEAAAAKAADAEAALAAAMAEAEGAVDPEVLAELEGQLEAAQAEAEAAAAAQAEAEAAAVAAAEEAAAAAMAAAPEPEAEDIPTTLVIAQDRDPQRLDPNFARGVEPETIVQTMYDSLIALDLDGVPVPSLAKSWSFPDESTLVFQLREGVQFHNGESFNAESVKVSVERIKSEDHGSHLKDQFGSIESVEIVDDYNVKLTLSRPEANLVYAFTRLMMIPPGYYAEVGDEGVEAHPVGTGPFMFVSYTVDDETVVRRNPNYWPDSPKGQPMVEEVRIRVIPEATVRVAELTTGGVHIADTVPADQRSVIDNAGLELMSFYDAKPFWMIMNRIGKGSDAEAATGDQAVQYVALQDKRVAQALNHAVDRQAIIDSLMGGDATGLGQPFGRPGFGYPADDEPYPYDPDLARQLLAEAGYPDGFHLDILATHATNLDTVVAVMGYFEEIGIRPKLEVINTTIGNQRWMAQSYPGLRVSSWNNPETAANLLFRTGGFVSVYSNPELDALLERDKITLDLDERRAVLKQITDFLHDDPFAVYLWTEPSRVGINQNLITGFQPHAKGFVLATGVSFIDG